MTDARKPQKPIKGRGAASRVAGRFEVTTIEGPTMVGASAPD
ncbi:hypothetical protein [Lysobacter sp. HA18]